MAKEFELIVEDAKNIQKKLSARRRKSSDVIQTIDPVKHREAPRANFQADEKVNVLDFYGKKHRVLMKEIKGLICHRYVEDLNARPLKVTETVHMVTMNNSVVIAKVSEDVFQDILARRGIPHDMRNYSYIDRTTKESYSFDTPSPTDSEIEEQARFFARIRKDKMKFDKSEDSDTDSKQAGEDIYMSEDLPTSSDPESK